MRLKTLSPLPTRSPMPMGSLPPTYNASIIASEHERRKEKDTPLPEHLPPRLPQPLSSPRHPVPTQASWTLAPSDQDCPPKSATDAYNKTCVFTVEGKTTSPGFALTNPVPLSVAMKPTSPLPLRSPLLLPLSPRPCPPIHVPVPPSSNLPQPLPPSQRKTSGPMC